MIKRIFKVKIFEAGRQKGAVVVARWEAERGVDRECVGSVHLEAIG